MHSFRIFDTLCLVLFCFVANSQALREQLTAELSELHKTSDLPGFSVAIVNKDETLYSKGFGLSTISEAQAFTSSTVHNLGSVSKTIVGLALIKAMKGGYLSLDDPINKHLSFEIKNPYYIDQPILIRHLANHTSTILDTKHYRNTYLVRTDYEPVKGVHEGYLEFLKSHEELSLEDFIKEILSEDGRWYKKKNFLKAAPGNQNNYANLNAALAALVIEGATGQSFEGFTSASIFEPIGMESTSWVVGDLGDIERATGYFPGSFIVPEYKLITYPDGGLYSNAEDLVKYLKEMIRAFAGQSDYLPKEYAVLLLPGDGDDDRVFFGMGEVSKNIGHQGSDPGTQVDFQFNADSKIGRIIICNVNAEDNEELWLQYVQIHKILAKYETKL